MSQKMGIHEWSYRQRRLGRRALQGALGQAAETRAGQTSAWKWSWASTPPPRSRRPSRCLNCDVQTIFNRDIGVHRVRRLRGHLPDGLHQRSRRERRRSPTCARSLKAPALEPGAGSLRVGQELKTGRVMAKDEDVCLHCGLCAERCPTGAWDMQKFLARRSRQPAPRPARRKKESPHERAAAARRGQDQPRRRSTIQAVNDFVIKFANVNGSGSASANELFAKADDAHGRAGEPAQHLSRATSRACPPGTRRASARAGYTGPARRHRHDGGDESADLGGGRRGDRVGRLPVLRQHAADAAVEASATTSSVIGVPLTEICQRGLQRIARQRQLFKNIIYVGALSIAARHGAGKSSRSLFAEQYKGKERLLDSNIQALHMGLRLRAART